MYQTVGHSWMPKLAKAAGLPLIRRQLQGTPVATASLSYYEAIAGDETEDLVELLREVKCAYPDITAISVGAILSDFQRLRVENVCGRLGLVVLAPLWQLAQPLVLDLIERTQIDARLIKVATLGLDDSHLGQSTTELRHHLRRIAAKFGVHEAGEGGEFESFVFAAPGILRRRLELTNPRVIRHAAEVWLLSGDLELGEEEHRPEQTVFDSVLDLSFYSEDFPRGSVTLYPTEKNIHPPLTISASLDSPVLDFHAVLSNPKISLYCQSDILKIF